jgi:hypothetical protein
VELIIPTQADLEAIYRKQVARLEALLTGSDQMVAANALLRDMLGEVRVQGDPDAVNRVIGHYSGYIAALSTRTSYDPQGCPHSQVDDDLRRRLETKLIIAILDFDLT